MTAHDCRGLLFETKNNDRPRGIATANVTEFGSRDCANDGGPNAIEALIDLLPCGRGMETELEGIDS